MTRHDDGWNSALHEIDRRIDALFEVPYPIELKPADVIGRRIWRRDQVRQCVRALIVTEQQDADVSSDD